MTDLSRLLAEVSADREAGTEDAWWRDRIGNFALDESYGRDEAINGGQDAADRRRILRVPKLERALAEAIRQRNDFAQDRERHAAMLVAAMKRLTEARDAWAAFKGATVSDEHFEAVARMDAALIPPKEDTTC
ncbi:MAG: hypothetical protein ACK4S2_07115 [Gemmobacter sp.]|uniref:hypothetical protein n=1 Tax=Gemmobacter sp. TaxID=1898957 RepID=UPI00391A123E